MKQDSFEAKAPCKRPGKRLVLAAALLLSGCAGPKLSPADRAAADQLNCMREARQTAIDTRAPAEAVCKDASGTYRFAADPGLDPRIRNLGAAPSL